jgi:glutamate 5-kinase
MREEIQNASTLVLKIGSSLLLHQTDGDSQGLNVDWLAAMASDIAQARAKGQKIILVTSGALALGCAKLGVQRQDLNLAQSQAASATGQIELVRGWQSALDAQALQSAQVLLTAEDTEQRRRYLNARQTLTALLDMGVIPVINENDTLATQELRYGDNDRLAARVAAMVSADCLVLFSDIDGLYTANPQETEGGEFLDVVEEITPEISAMAGGSGSQHGSGGMVTKLQAGEIAQSAGCHMVLASGRALSPLTALAQGARSTLFRAHANPLTARKNWIASTLHPAGTIHLDAGAVRALAAGNSLLPVGISRLEGNFERGDCLSIIAPDGQEIARGLSAYARLEAGFLVGKDSKAIAALPEFSDYNLERTEMVHRDDMVLMTSPSGGTK